MGKIHITYCGQKMMKRLPRFVLLNGRPIGLMQTGEANITLPEGNYFLTIQFGGRIPLYPRNARTALGRWLQKKNWNPDLSVGSTECVHVGADEQVELRFCDKEKAWNILFDIDMVLWLVSLFITLPSPWGGVYHLISDAFFVIWLIRLFVVRKRYYRFILR